MNNNELENQNEKIEVNEMKNENIDKEKFNDNVESINNINEENKDITIKISLKTLISLLIVIVVVALLGSIVYLQASSRVNLENSKSCCQNDNKKYQILDENNESNSEDYNLNKREKDCCKNKKK